MTTTILPNTSYNGQNNDPQDFVSDPLVVFLSNNSTFVFYVLNFTGTIKVQATVLPSKDATEADWFDVDIQNLTDHTETYFKNIVGNFNLIRIKGSFTAGTIEKILMRQGR